MYLTVKDALAIYPLTNAELIAGEGGTDNVISTVSVLEIPEMKGYIEKGQLEISAFYAIAEDEDKQLDAIEMLHEAEAAGLILTYVGRILKRIPESMIALCNKLNFPLILVGNSVAYSDIISPIMDKILKIQSSKLRYAMKIYDKMGELMLEKRDFESIVSECANALSRKVAYYNYENHCIASSFGLIDKECNDFIIENIEANLNCFVVKKHDVIICPEDKCKSRLLFCPISSSITFYGVMIVFDAEALSELDYITIAQTKNALGIVTLNKINMNDYYKSLFQDYINDLINWKYADESTALKRGIALGYNLEKIKMVAILDFCNFSQLSEKKNEDEIQIIKSLFYNTVSNELNHLQCPGFMISYSDKIILLFDNISNDQLNTKKHVNFICSQLMKAVKKNHGWEINAGISSYNDGILNIAKGYREALSTLSVTAKILKPGAIVHHKDVEFLAAIAYPLSPETKEHAKKLFEPVKNHDAVNNTELYETFMALCKNDFDTNKVSEILFVHRNTVLQRKKKLMEIFPYDPFSMPYKIQFQLAAILI